MGFLLRCKRIGGAIVSGVGEGSPAGAVGGGVRIVRVIHDIGDPVGAPLRPMFENVGEDTGAISIWL